MKKLFVTAVFIVISFQVFCTPSLIRSFSDKQSYEIIKTSLPLNPQIKNANLIYPGEIFGYIIDGTRVTVLFKKGDNLTNVLKRGIPEDLILECKLIESSEELQAGIKPPIAIGEDSSKSKIDWIKISLIAGMGVILVFFMKRIKRLFAK